jgi:hypothetical protein
MAVERLHCEGNHIKTLTMEKRIERIEFLMTINSLSPSYASHPITRGPLSHLWTFYLFGQDCDNLYGRRLVCDFGQTPTPIGDVSKMSAPLKINVEYSVIWEYSPDDEAGAKLFVNGVEATDEYTNMNFVRKQVLEYDLDPEGTLVLKENWYSGGGRWHTEFDGTVDVRHSVIGFSDGSVKVSGLPLSIDRMQLSNVNALDLWSIKHETRISRITNYSAPKQTDTVYAVFPYMFKGSSLQVSCRITNHGSTRAGVVGSGGHPGIAFNFFNDNDFEELYFRPHWAKEGVQHLRKVGANEAYDLSTAVAASKSFQFN